MRTFNYIFNSSMEKRWVLQPSKSFPFNIGLFLLLSFLLSRWRSFRHLSFLLKQPLFALGSPAIPPQAAIFAHNAMAGNEQWDGILLASLCHGPAGLWLTNRAGDSAVRARLAVGDSAQFFPNAPLKGGSANIHRQVQVRLLACKMIYHRLQPGAQAFSILADLGGWILVEQRAF